MNKIFLLIIIVCATAAPIFAMMQDPRVLMACLSRTKEEDPLLQQKYPYNSTWCGISCTNDLYDDIASGRIETVKNFLKNSSLDKSALKDIITFSQKNISEKQKKTKTYENKLSTLGLYGPLAALFFISSAVDIATYAALYNEEDENIKPISKINTLFSVGIKAGCGLKVLRTYWMSDKNNYTTALAIHTLLQEQKPKQGDEA